MPQLKAVVFDWGHTIMNEVKDANLPLASRPIHLMPGMEEVLPKIELPMGVWANTRSSTASDVESWLKRAGIREYFSCIVTSADVGHRKPDARFFSAALEQCGFNKDEVLFIGNQLNSDIRGANEFGIQNVWLSGEIHRSKDDTLKPGDVEPTYIVASLAEVPALIKQLMTQ